MSFEHPLENPGKDAKKPEVHKEAAMGKDPFVSGAYRSEEDEGNRQPKQAVPEIIDQAVKHKRFKRSLHQPYASEATLETKRAMKRMLGEKEG